MKVLITGAHFTPAKAVIEELINKPNIKIVYIGRKTTMEGDKASSVESLEFPKLKIKYRTLVAGRIRRDLSIYTFLSILKIPIGVLQSLAIVLSEKPDIILSFGGYVSVPVVFAGWLLSIPIIIHEQGLVMGLANHICSIFADKIALSFAKKNLTDKEIITGNPLRKEIVQPMKEVNKDYRQILEESKNSRLPLVLITGGNQGSHAINRVVEQSLPKLLKIACVIHQTGESKYKDFERLTPFKNEKYLVTKWIGEDIGYILSRVDLVVCRSGMNTLMEAAYFGVPVLTIPISKHYEQNQNALFFQKICLANILYQTKLTSKNLEEEIKQMLKNTQNLKQKTRKAKLQIIPDASKRLALETVLLAEQSTL